MARHYSLAELRKRVAHGDVTFDLQRLGYLREEGTREEALEIQKLGYRNQALSWLRSRSEKEMQYGKFNREQRLEEAKKFAALANLDLAVIAQEAGLTDLL